VLEILSLGPSGQVVLVLIRLRDLSSEISVMFLEYLYAGSHFSSAPFSVVIGCGLDDLTLD
jgi:hypothetical protein